VIFGLNNILPIPTPPPPPPPPPSFAPALPPPPPPATIKISHITFLLKITVPDVLKVRYLYVEPLIAVSVAPV